jgi:hypothetical protein
MRWSINGKLSASFVLDSGASVTVLNRPLFEELSVLTLVPTPTSPERRHSSRRMARSGAAACSSSSR